MSLIDNKKVHFNYEILDTIEAGIELLGFEVKSIRTKHGVLDASYAHIRDGKATLINAYIPPYQAGNTPESYNPERTRNLLLSKKEMRDIESRLETHGLTIVPIAMYNKGSKIKVSLGIGRGKKTHDKRESSKKREVDRDIRRTLKTGK